MLILLVVAIAAGWFADRTKLEVEKASIEVEKASINNEFQALCERFRLVAEDEKLELLSRVRKGIGKPVADFPELQTLASRVYSPKGRDFICYEVGLPEPAVEGAICGFFVLTRDGQVCDILVDEATW